jgi:hypothetical protein
MCWANATRFVAFAKECGRQHHGDVDTVRSLGFALKYEVQMPLTVSANPTRDSMRLESGAAHSIHQQCRQFTSFSIRPRLSRCGRL